MTVFWLKKAMVKLTFEHPSPIDKPGTPDTKDRLVCVTVCTLKRPQMLEKCLNSIAGQIVPDGWQFCLVVVENTPDNASEKIALKVKAQTGVDLTYMNEPNRGIPQARNRAMAQALMLNADWIAFIDDDETAEPGWLAAYCTAADQYDAQILRGPVNLAYPPQTPDWYPKLSKPVEETGSSEVMFSTSNLMISQHLISPLGYGLKFNEDMRFTGGSDWEFCSKAVKCGAKAITVSNAVVIDEVVGNRITLKWLLQRQTRISANKSWGRIKRLGRFLSVIIIVAQAVMKSLTGFLTLIFAALLLPFSVTRAKYWASKAIISFAAAFGYLLPIFGILPQPYREVDGY